jgi:hypothetical protein
MGIVHQIEPPIEAGRRSHSRLRVRLPARLMTVMKGCDVFLFDLGQFGAKLRISEPIAAGTQVMLFWGGHEAFGAVAWVRGEFCGIAFDEAVPASILIATRDLDDVAHMNRADDMDRRAARLWTEGGSRV